ncbi:4-hydroxyphenylpyruvate dioxygenase [Trichormus variabilis]|uniref:4-hydroxyphenylpyruvate dioxygenase n=1 Tax=Trichormus variabilis SAG 1403-4b TaxID=447716 RepID=A0A3S1AI20_ANAVA|nr:4-hydroxyphenylpyruvate dioxygenase [Trichormus variabilis]MBD2627077.1 4-hydroxyphenylpyruvate dioxygenase [Trichormus variabilis FACHB-164]RUS92698.1 4-hydroxyphenylpyruvate dioxygenase [Trichormus variabilis SAG 1403-4b]
MLQIDHVHFYVEDAQWWRDWFVKHLGFQSVVSSIFPTLVNRGKSFHTCTEVVKNGNVYFLLSSPLLPTSPVAEFLRHHPPGVADVAFLVTDVETVTARASAKGAKVLQPVQNEVSFKFAKIAAWGGLTHTLMERQDVKAEDGERNLPPIPNPQSPNVFTAIDHVVLNVEVGNLQAAVSWYENILDFQPQQSFKIQTNRSALSSQVMISPNGGVQLPINEPASPNSQIQEFLDVNRGAGIQHIALRTPNLVSAIARFRAAGVSFLSVPQTYYSQLQERLEVPLSPSELQAIAQQEILVDCQQDAPLGALLLQIFTQPIFSEPTFFFEFIERRSQAQGFGEGNFRALFEAIESEQIKRGFVSQ